MSITHAAFFKMLSTRSRVRILQVLAERGEISVDELCSQLSVTSTTVSRHLQLLRMQGLVTVRQEAQNRYYSLSKEKIAQQIASFLDDLAIDLPEKASLRSRVDVHSKNR